MCQLSELMAIQQLPLIYKDRITEGYNKNRAF